jgi:hypothetical protein
VLWPSSCFFHFTYLSTLNVRRILTVEATGYVIMIPVDVWQMKRMILHKKADPLNLLGEWIQTIGETTDRRQRVAVTQWAYLGVHKCSIQDKSGSPAGAQGYLATDKVVRAVPDHGFARICYQSCTDLMWCRSCIPERHTLWQGSYGSCP